MEESQNGESKNEHAEFGGAIMKRANDADVLQLEISIVLDFKSKEYQEKDNYDNYDKFFSLDEF